MATSCAAASDSTPSPAVTPAKKDQPLFPDKEFDFVERPSQDFFCPVSLELLLEPQLTSCCGHHLSLEVANRLQKEGKPCPVCNSESWSAMLDKYHGRRVREVRVRCWNKDSGCGWVGEVNELKRHAVSCEKRPWECEYCGLKCTYDEGEGKHWPECPKFPEPCPNGCEVGSVERCGMEQHHSVCPLEPVACEMEFGCSVVVPRRELATHMRESGLQHLTAMTALNLRLTRQLQQESAERDKKLEQLQQESTERDRKFEQLRQDLTERDKKFEQLTRRLQQDSAERGKKLEQLQKDSAERDKKIVQLQQDSAERDRKIQEELKALAAVVKEEVESCVKHIDTQCHTLCGWKVLEFKNYRCNKEKAQVDSLSDKFYSHNGGYAFKLLIKYYGGYYNDIGALLCLVKGENDDQLSWPVKVFVTLELLNQAGNNNHLQRCIAQTWTKGERANKKIDDSLIKYAVLEKTGDNLKYLVNDCLKFRISVSVP